MFSQTVEYALRAMLYLASLDRAAVNSETIAGATGVPAGYLSKVMRDLVVAGLVASFRGPHGGFTLAREAADITVFDVVNAVDPFHRVLRGASPDPLQSKIYPLHRRLDDALTDIERTLRTTTLAQVLEEDRANEGAA